MSAPSFTRFEQLLLDQPHPAGVSALLLLVWLGSTDGPLSEVRKARLTEAAEAAGLGELAASVLDMAGELDPDTLQLASEFVSRHLRGADAVRFLEDAVRMSRADGRLSPAGNHGLRLLADLVGAPAPTLSDVYRSITGKPMPEPPDPSRAGYWAEREANARRRLAARTTPRARAFETLGLTSDATKEDIRTAYRKLARVHHPDRFCQQGPEAVATATLTFQRIKSAYEHLVRHA